MFHGAIADTSPDAWGRRVIARDHAKRRRIDPQLRPLTELDYLLAVDDFSRVDALRLRDSNGPWHRTVPEGRRATPPLIELERIYRPAARSNADKKQPKTCATWGRYVAWWHASQMHHRG